MNESIVSTIEERQENSDENVKDLKKQVKMVSEKVVEMEERQRRAIIWIIGVPEKEKQNNGTDLRFKIPIQENIL